MAEKVQKLTREEIGQFAKTLRQVRFFESLQTQSFEVPDELAAIYQAIEDLQVLAGSIRSRIEAVGSQKEVFIGATLPPVSYPAIGFKNIGSNLFLMQVNG